MSRFGTDTVGPSNNTQSADFKEAYRKYLGEDGIASKVVANLTGLAAGSQAMKCALYRPAADSGLPLALIAVTAEVTVPASTAAAWYDFVFSSPVYLKRGHYWIAIWTGPTNNASTLAYFVKASGISGFNANTYASGGSPTDPYGSFSAGTHDASIYVEYDPVLDPDWSQFPIPNLRRTKC